MTSIRYFVPEDGDSESQPNVFLAPKARQQGTPPTLGQVKQAFPLPGKYHFRFKTALGGGTSGHALAVWMDCTDDRQPVFVWKNQIIAKVTRIGVEEDEDDDDDDEDFRRPQQQQQTQQPAQQQYQQPVQTTTASATPAQQPKAPPQPTVSTSSSFDIFDADHRAPSSSAPAASGDLLGGHHHNPSSSTSGSGNLLDMSFNGPTTTTTPSHHHDFLGMTAAPSPPVSGNYNPFGGLPQQTVQQQRPPAQQPRTTFDSFGSNPNDAFGGLGTPWK